MLSLAAVLLMIFGIWEAWVDTQGMRSVERPSFQATLPRLRFYPPSVSEKFPRSLVGRPNGQLGKKPVNGVNCLVVSLEDHPNTTDDFCTSK